MSWETFAALWSHPVGPAQRNWVPDFATYRDAFTYLLLLRRPHVARLSIPVTLQPLLIATFLDGHQLWLHDEHPGSGYAKLTIWRPAEPPTPDEQDASLGGA